MRRARRALSALLVLAALGAGCAAPEIIDQPGLDVQAWPEGKGGAETPREGAGSVETRAEYSGIERGLGAEHRSQVAQALELVEAERVREAHDLLDAVLQSFQTKMGDRGAIYISVATADELALFQRFVPDERQVIWLDWSFREALHAKAFLAAGQRDFQQALEFLEVEATFAPFSAAAYCERGYVFNQLKRPREGLEAYKTALDLAVRFDSSTAAAPIAWRGIGYSLIELGDLDSAEQAYQESLKLQPGNPLALQELEFIRKLRERPQDGQDNPEPANPKAIPDFDSPHPNKLPEL